MNSLKLSSLFLTLFVLIFGNIINAQTIVDTTVVWQVETNDGNKYIGTIIEETTGTIYLKTAEIGTVSIKKKSIAYKEIYAEATLVNGRIWPKNEILNRYGITPTGMFQAKGHSYYENKFAFVNHLNLAISDNFSLGLGVLPLFFFDGLGVPVWIAPKFKIPTKNKNLHLAVGVGWGKFVLDEYYGDANYLIPFFMGTYGNDRFSFSAGFAYGYWEYTMMPSPAFSFSGSIRVNKRSYLFMENLFVNTFTKDPYYADSPRLVVCLGSRISWSRMTLDFGGIIPTGQRDEYYDDRFFIGPYLALLVPLWK